MATKQDEAQPLLHRQPQSQPPRSALSLRERKLKNLQKRVKLRSKRLRVHWPKIAAFLDLKGTVALASTCRRMKQVLQDDQVWQQLYTSVRSQRLTQLIIDEEARKSEEKPASVKQSLQRLVHARHVLDPTNALQRRLQEAEREVHRIATMQRKTQELFRLNIAFVFVLCCISMVSFLFFNDESNGASGHRSSSVSHLKNNKHQGSALKTFMVALDVLSLMAVLILSFGSVNLSEPRSLGTAGLLGFLQCVMMAFMFFAWASLDQLLHAGVVLAAAVFNVVMAKRKQREYEQEVETFVSKY